MREELKKAFEEMLKDKAGKGGFDFKKMFGDEIPNNAKVLCGSMSDVAKSVKEAFDSMVDKAMSDMLEPYKIEFNPKDMELTTARMTVANLDFDVDMNVPVCEIFLIKKKERTFLDGAVVKIEHGPSLDLGKKSAYGMSIGLAKLDEEFWNNKNKETQNKEAVMTDLLAETLENLFGANKERVKDILEKAYNEDNNCNCPKCLLNDVVAAEFARLVEKNISGSMGAAEMLMDLLSKLSK